jgi:hypothetical protein
MSGVLPVKIVTLGTLPASQVQAVEDLGNSRLRIINSDALAANVSGGVIPMTQATYDAMIAAGSVAA